MRARVLLWVCLGLNILLAAALVWVWERPQPAPALSPASAQVKTNTSPSRTHVVVRRQGFTWNEIESADFPTYIKNLRDIGCPEHTIRDIIVAEVDDLFAERMTKELNLPEQKWWLPDPDMEVLQAGMDQVRALQSEKEQLLTQLLGPGWQDQRSNVAAASIRFDGSVLANISPEAKANVERIERNARRISSEAAQRARAEGRDITTQERARLREGTRRELAAVLSPQQLEEYLLRYSQTADEMREQLRGFGANADEFRRIFQAQDQFDQQLATLGDDAASASRRAELTRLRDEAVRQAIGPERFALYQASQNPLFRQAQEQAEQSGAPAEKVLPIFRLNQAVAEEIARIQTDTSLSEDQRRIALVTVQQQQQNSIQRILTDQPAEQPATPPVPQISEVAPAPFPPYPEGFERTLRATLPPTADLPPGVNTTTKGPTYRGRR
jgi:hypothetical protein